MLEKIMEFLRKIGMLRSGSSSYSGDASKRPISMQGDHLNFDQSKKKPVPPKK